VNVVLYRPEGARWVMTERAPHSLVRTPSSLTLGHTHVAWEGDALVVRFDERCATFPSPMPARLAGQVRLWPQFVDGVPVVLDGPTARHRWCPVAPSARAEVVLDEPGLRFSGAGYVDANHGDEPLERGFRGWHWSRMKTREGAALAYHTTPRAGSPLALVRRYDGHGRAQDLDGTELGRVGPTGWRLRREVAVDRGVTPRAVWTLEDTPFYARSLIDTVLGGDRGLAMHETLDAERFARRWVQFLLPFRTRREAR
jgi:carotenoid 1,2-hydratase